jgi:hypothetical protein
MLGGALAKAGAREAMQAADGERGQRPTPAHWRRRVGVASRRFGQHAQALPQLRLDTLEELVHARDQALVLEHQRIAHHHPRHAGILLAELEQHRHHPVHLHGSARLALDDLVDEREHALLDEFDKALEHLRLAGEVTVERGLGDIELGREGCGGDALGAGLLQHRRQHLEDLHPPLARTRALARRRRGRQHRRQPGDDAGCQQAGLDIARFCLIAGSTGSRVG